MALQTIPGRAIELGSDAAGDLAYYDGSKWTRLAKGTAGQLLKQNSGATAPEWVTATYATEAYVDAAATTTHGELIYHVVTGNNGGSGTWTKPAGVNKIFLYISDRISNNGPAHASSIYLDVTNVTSYPWTTYTYSYNQATAYGSLTFGGRNGGSSCISGTNDETLAFFGGRYPGPAAAGQRPVAYILGYAA